MPTRNGESVILMLDLCNREKAVFSICRDADDLPVVAIAEIPWDMLGHIICHGGDPAKFINQELEAYREALDRMIAEARKEMRHADAG